MIEHPLPRLCGDSCCDACVGVPIVSERVKILKYPLKYPLELDRGKIALLLIAAFDMTWHDIKGMGKGSLKMAWGRHGVGGELRQKGDGTAGLRMSTVHVS